MENVEVFVYLNKKQKGIDEDLSYFIISYYIVLVLCGTKQDLYNYIVKYMFVCNGLGVLDVFASRRFL